MKLMEALWRDLHYSARMLLKRRGFAAVAVITLALGIGANTAIFSLVRGVLLRPLPFSESERLIGIRESKVGEGQASDYSVGLRAKEKFSRKGAKNAKAQRRVKSFGHVRVFDPPLRLCVNLFLKSRARQMC